MSMNLVLSSMSAVSLSLLSHSSRSHSRCLSGSENLYTGKEDRRVNGGCGGVDSAVVVCCPVSRCSCKEGRLRVVIASYRCVKGRNGVHRLHFPLSLPSLPSPSHLSFPSPSVFPSSPTVQQPSPNPHPNPHLPHSHSPALHSHSIHSHKE